MYTHSQHLHDYEKSVFYRAGTARDMYNQVLKHKNINTGAPGVGDMAFFEGGPSGHAALGVGGGYVISNDINGKYQKVLYTDLEKLWGSEGKYLGYTVPTGLYGGKETDSAEALKKELGSAYKLPGTSVGSSGTTGSTDTKPGTGDAVKPAVAATSPTTATSPSTTSSSDRGMFGSLFGSIFGSMSQPSSTVAQSPTASSSTPGVSAQFESHIPTMSDLGSSTSSSAGSASSLDSTGGTENVTVEPVGG
jgi:hypothetical protein